MALSNPFLIVVLLAVTELYYSIGVLYVDMGANLLFILGFQAGTFLWLRLIGSVVSLNRHHLSGVSEGSVACAAPPTWCSGCTCWGSL